MAVPTEPEWPLPVVRVSGEPPECGFGYGVAAGDRIGANLTLYLRRFRDQAGLDRAEVRRAGRAFREVTAAHHGRVGQLLDGVAEGAGVDVDELHALNARTELLAGTFAATSAGTPAATSAGQSASAGTEGCTALGVLGTHTATGHLLLGQNWDWYPEQRDAMVLLETRDETGLGVLALTEAGMLAKTGLNSAGLGVCVNLLGCDRDGFARAGAAGVPYHVLLRAVLEAGSLPDALKRVFRGVRNSSINLLIGAAGPAGGELIDLELVPGDAGWAHPVDGLLTHANHLETGLPVRDTVKETGGSTLFRAARARRLLAGPAAVAKVTGDDLAAVLRDHAGFPQAICRHADPTEPPAEQSESVYSILLDLDDRRLGLAAGPPCEHDYRWLGLTG